MNAVPAARQNRARPSRSRAARVRSHRLRHIDLFFERKTGLFLFQNL